MPLADLIALVAPPACAACRAPLPRAGAPVCAGCLSALPWLGADACRRCGLPRHRGGGCPAAAAPFASAWSPLAYDGPARALVHALKFRGALPLAGLMAAQMAANAPPWALAGCEAVVPVPPVAARRRRRGFDPADALAGELARRLGLAHERCLMRGGAGARQLGAGRETRRTPGRIDVRVRRPPPRTALLCDDVHTTGATLAACARALRASGCESVHAVAYARAL